MKRYFNGFEFLFVGRGRSGRDDIIYDISEIIDLSKKYKYIYKATRNFRKMKFDGRYTLYLFSNYNIENNIIDFFNKLSITTYFNQLNMVTLYSIKDKVEIL
jgi:hypothetical protein